MKRKQLKFALGSMIIILTLSYLAYSGYQESKTYYHTVPELYALKDKAFEQRLQVSGDVVPGSIKREGKVVSFAIGQEPQTLNVKYVGKDPLPDTLIDRATAMATGKMGRDGVFVADTMLAKCASKYEKEKAAGVQISKKE
ncbi:MAG: cytochrome c biogenesis protein CcmE [Acidobacteria bacterium]|nr:MAG: cytochrome c biogenesis protein CcmE [Acidobacteriota bacterium]